MGAWWRLGARAKPGADTVDLEPLRASATTPMAFPWSKWTVNKRLSSKGAQRRSCAEWQGRPICSLGLATLLDNFSVAEAPGESRQKKITGALRL
jgi:hypothetical protein